MTQARAIFIFTMVIVVTFLLIIDTAVSSKHFQKGLKTHLQERGLK